MPHSSGHHKNTATTATNSNSNTGNNNLKRVFSIDDETKDIENDIKYLEGLHDGLKIMSGKKISITTTTAAAGMSSGSTTPNNNNNNKNIIINNPDNDTIDTIDNKDNTSNTDNIGSSSSSNNNNNSNTSGNTKKRLARYNSVEFLSKAIENQKHRNKSINSIASGNSTTTNAKGHVVDVDIHDLSNLIRDIRNNSAYDEEQDPDVERDQDVDREVRDNTVDGENTRDENNNNTNNGNDNDNGNDNGNGNGNEDGEDDNANDNDDRESIESFTLKDKQEAINETHPFGIRIWKPALYKKNRSIMKHALQDLHETKYKDLPLSIRVNNMIWCFTMGTVLLLLFLALSVIVFVLSGFGFNEHCIKYSNVFRKVGFYLFYPFGKIVYILKDENYKDEDKNEGISSMEFYKWITSYRLFKSNAPLTTTTTTSTTNSSMRGESASREAGEGNTSTPLKSDNSNNNNISISPIQNISINDSTDSTLLNPYHSLNYGSMNRKSIMPNPTGRLFSKMSNNGGASNVEEINDQDSQQQRQTGEEEEEEGNGSIQRNAQDKRADRKSFGSDENIFSFPNRMFGRGEWSLARIVFYLLFYTVVFPVLGLLSLLCWLGVFTIPMSNVLITILIHMRKHPLHFSNKPLKNFKKNHLTNNILLCTFRCSGLHYYKYTVDGTNVIVMNLICLVIFTIFDFFVLKPYYGPQLFICKDVTIFILCLLSTIPLAFYIGQGVASISAQTSMGVGAVINAFFSTIVEIFLYCVSLRQEKGLIVEGSLVGSILAGVLLLPGLSMCGGALFRKTQHYNPKSAGVSAAMLIFSMMVMFIPTILFLIYGDYTVDCKSAIGTEVVETIKQIIPLEKQNCHFEQVPLELDDFYFKIIKPISTLSAVLLFVVYFIGLLFTLRTHAAMIWELPISETEKKVALEDDIEDQDDEDDGKKVEGGGGHEAPNWTRSKSMIILLIATLAYAIIAEILVDCVDSVLKNYPSVKPKFLGLTIFALVPNTTEFLNAISFAMNGNVALSMEIGSAYVLQVCLLQIPSLVIYSLFKIPSLMNNNNNPSLGNDLLPKKNIRDYMFTLVFTRWDFIACMVSVFLFTYLYGEGKSNYFKGTLLIFFYIVMMFGFYLQIKLEEYSL